MSYRRWVFLAVLAALAMGGCKREDPDAGQTPVQTISETEIAAARDAMTRGMTAVPLDKMTAAYVGRRCVVVVGGPYDDSPPPPPLGMVHRMGPVTIYTARVHEVSPDSLKILATYPTSGNKKIVDIPRASIQSVHVGD
ncbi:MAG TPA: hypothetical protein PKH24_07310 [Sedimentisphaerales bacterium]|nr:hypothetical protein [Sedimentisphaerales bacterium]HNU30631.1 hypothetical protein [Sedimentisphaerales bacterium]